MNKKGFSLIEFMIILSVIGLLLSVAVPEFFDWAEEQEVAQKTGNLIKEFKQESEPTTVTKTVTVDRSGVNCQDGVKVIEIDGVIYHLGTIKNTWGDLAPVECQ